MHLLETHFELCIVEAELQVNTSIKQMELTGCI